MLPSTALIEPVHDGPELTGESAFGWKPRPQEEVDGSWLRQVTLIEVEGVVVRLQACLDECAFAGVEGDQCTRNDAR